MSLVNVMCCPVDVSLRGRSFFHRSPTYCGVSVCDLETLVTAPSRDASPKEKKKCVPSLTQVLLIRIHRWCGQFWANYSAGFCRHYLTVTVYLL